MFNYIGNWNWTNYQDSLVGGFTGTLLVIMLFLLIIFFVALYVYMALAFMSIAKKTKTKNAWLAWVPIANFYLLTQMAKKSRHWTWILLLALIPLPFAGLVIAGVGIWFFWIVAERIKFPGWISLFLLIPLVNLIILGILAWSKK